MDTIYGIAPDFKIRPRYYFKQKNWSVEEQVPEKTGGLSEILIFSHRREPSGYHLTLNKTGVENIGHASPHATSVKNPKQILFKRDPQEQRTWYSLLTRTGNNPHIAIAR